MVQVLDYVPSFGERLGPVLQQAGSTIGQAFQHHQSKKKDDMLWQQLQNPEIKDKPLQQIHLISQFSPERRKSFETILGPIFAEQQKASNQSEQIKQFTGQGSSAQSQFDNQFRGGMPLQEGDPQNIKPSTTTPPNTSASPNQPQGGLGQYSDEQLVAASGMSGPIGQISKEELKRRGSTKDAALKQEQISQNAREFAHKETTKYAEGLRSASEKAEEIKDAVKEVRRVIKKQGATGPTAKNIAFTYLKDKNSPFANLFQSADTQGLITAAKTLAGGGIKELVGGRPTEKEFFWFENILPDILKDAFTNEKSAAYFDKIADNALKKQEIFDDIVKKNKGFRPIDIDAQVREKNKEQLEKLISEGYSIYKKQGNSLETAPDAKKYTGKIIEDDQGNRFKSNGKSWELI